MPRGGHREGAGRKGGWKNSETQVIRVPKIFAAQLLDIARRLDLGEPENLVLPVFSVDPVQPIAESETPQVNPDQMDLFELTPEVIESVTESNTRPSRPDGLRWLSSEQAWKVSQTRGCERNLEGFRKWSKRKPDSCSELYGLLKLPSPPKGNTTTPAFEDLQYEEFDPDQHF
jgi:hypothetical protein